MSPATKKSVFLLFLIVAFLLLSPGCSGLQGENKPFEKMPESKVEQNKSGEQSGYLCPDGTVAKDKSGCEQAKEGNATKSGSTSENPEPALKQPRSVSVLFKGPWFSENVLRANLGIYSENGSLLEYRIADFGETVMLPSGKEVVFRENSSEKIENVSGVILIDDGQEIEVPINGTYTAGNCTVKLEDIGLANMSSFQFERTYRYGDRNTNWLPEDLKTDWYDPVLVHRTSFGLSRSLDLAEFSVGEKLYGRNGEYIEYHTNATLAPNQSITYNKDYPTKLRFDKLRLWGEYPKWPRRGVVIEIYDQDGNFIMEAKPEILEKVILPDQSTLEIRDARPEEVNGSFTFEFPTASPSGKKGLKAGEKLDVEMDYSPNLGLGFEVNDTDSTYRFVNFVRGLNFKWAQTPINVDVDTLADVMLNDAYSTRTHEWSQYEIDRWREYYRNNARNVYGEYAFLSKNIYVQSALKNTEIYQTLAHELIHALQDQYFGLSQYRNNLSGDELQSVLVFSEGEATLVEKILNYTMERGRLPGLNASIEWDHTEKPDYYGYGYDFVYYFYRERSWSAIDEIWKNPPKSTEQILHPEKYPNESFDRFSFDIDLGTDFKKECYTQGELGLIDLANKSIAGGWNGDYYCHLWNDKIDLIPIYYVNPSAYVKMIENLKDDVEVMEIHWDDEGRAMNFLNNSEVLARHYLYEYQQFGKKIKQYIDKSPDIRMYKVSPSYQNEMTIYVYVEGEGDRTFFARADSLSIIHDILSKFGKDTSLVDAWDRAEKKNSALYEPI